MLEFIEKQVVKFSVCEARPNEPSVQFERVCVCLGPLKGSEAGYQARSQVASEPQAAEESSTTARILEVWTLVDC